MVEPYTNKFGIFTPNLCRFAPFLCVTKQKSITFVIEKTSRAFYV